MKFEEYQAFFNNILSLEDRKKEYSDDIKAAFDAFGSNNNIKVKALKKAYKEYKEFLKDENEFLETDTESDAIIQVMIPQYRDTEKEAA